MKIGMFINTQFPEGDSVAARIPELVEQVRVAREAGFASCCFRTTISPRRCRCCRSRR